MEAINDIEVLQEVNELLIQHLGAAKAARFWTIIQSGSGDYVKMREAWFSGETVDSLYQKIRGSQEHKGDEAKS